MILVLGSCTNEHQANHTSTVQISGQKLTKNNVYCRTCDISRYFLVDSLNRIKVYAFSKQAKVQLPHTCTKKKNASSQQGGLSLPYKCTSLLLRKTPQLWQERTKHSPHIKNTNLNTTRQKQTMPAEEPAFDIAVESVGTSSTLAVPPGWTSSTHKVGAVTVEAHVHPTPTTKSLGPPVITVHDVGMNAPSCFGSFFAFCRTAEAKCPELDSAAAHYHLTAPGHEPDAPTLPSSDAIDIDTLVRAAGEVIDRFELPRAIGFGVGIGAAVMLRAAIQKNVTFAGLILISPLIEPAGIVEKMTVGADGMFSRGFGLGLSRRAKDRFLWRWLRDDTRDLNFSLVQNLEDGLDRLNPANLTRFLAADSWRDDITQDLKSIKAKVLLVTGKESALRHHSADRFHQFDPEHASWLDVQECGSLVHEEYPEQMAQSVSLFMQGIPPINP